MASPIYYKFSIVITTKNRLKELKITLNSLQIFIENGVALIICDDASTDGTYQYLKKECSSASIIKNNKSKGLIYSRNRLLAMVRTPYAISLDDDLNFLSANPLETIENYFKKNPNCGVLSFRIFWSKSKPKNFATKEIPHRVKNYAGGAHSFRMRAWNDIPDYPEWFVFYGEEEFASYHLLKKRWEVHYLPKVLVHHRVNIKSRKKQKDYILRSKRSLRAGWYLYFMFLPWKYIPEKFGYTLLAQFRLKVFKGDLKAFIAVVLAMLDVLFHFPKLLRNRDSLSEAEFKLYIKLLDIKLYWNPE